MLTLLILAAQKENDECSLKPLNTEVPLSKTQRHRSCSVIVKTSAALSGSAKLKAQRCGKLKGGE